MATISPRSRSFDVKFADKVTLPPSNVPTKIRWNTHNRFGEKCKDVNPYPTNGHHFPKSRSFDVKFADKVTLTPSTVPDLLKYNQNRLGEKCKNVISDP